MSRSVMALALLLALVAPATAMAWSDDPQTPEGWAWTQITADQIVDFNDHCGKTLDPHSQDGWDDACRQIPSQFLSDVLTKPRWREHVGRHGVRLRGASIRDKIDLSDAEIPFEFWLEGSRIEGELDINDTHMKQYVSFDGSVFDGPLFGDRLTTDSEFSAQDHAVFSADVSLSGATFGNDVGLETAAFSQTLSIDGMRIHGSLYMGDHAKFGGDVDMSATEVDGHVELDTSVFAKALDASLMDVHGGLSMSDHASFAGGVNLSGTTVGGILAMNAARFSQVLDASLMDIHGGLSMRDQVSFAGKVNLSGTTIGGIVAMDTARFSQGLDAALLSVHGMALLTHASFAGDVNLRAATIAATLDMDGVSFAKTLNADGVNVGGSLFMRDHAAFAGDVILVGAKIGSTLDLDTASVAGVLNANSLNAESSVFMRNHGSFAGDVIFVGARVGANLETDASFFGRAFNAVGMDVHGRVLMRDGATFAGDVILNGAKVGWLELAGATLSGIDMSDVSGGAGSELILTGVRWRCRQVPIGGEAPASAQAAAPAPVFTWPLGDPSWQTARCPGGDAALPKMSLRNAHIESFQDSIDAWPPWLDLEGLHYDRLGGINGVGRADMRLRTPEQWVDWLDRDRTYSSQPYTQLAAVLTAAGRRDTAEAVLFAGNERERNEAWSRPDVGSWQWMRLAFPSWLWRSFLAFVAGYGIGLYTFRVLWWVIGLTILGALVLWFSPYARRHSVVWRLGASLHRLLPIVVLSKEFEEFFENKHEPHKPLKLHPWQMAFFAGIALAGWVLGFFLLAAMGGLTQK